MSSRIAQVALLSSIITSALAVPVIPTGSAPYPKGNFTFPSGTAVPSGYAHHHGHHHFHKSKTATVVSFAPEAVSSAVDAASASIEAAAFAGCDLAKRDVVTVYQTVTATDITVTVTSGETASTAVVAAAAEDSPETYSSWHWRHSSRKSKSSAVLTAAASTSSAAPVAETSETPTSVDPPSTSSVYVAPSTSSVYVAPTSSVVEVPSSTSEPTSTVEEATSVTPEAVSTSSSAAAAATSSASSSSSVSKRGLPYNDVDMTTPFEGTLPGWAYNWGQTAGDLGSSLEYIPMLWGTTKGFPATWNDNAAAAIASGSTALLGFNEPDAVAQSNLSPDDAATAYKTYLTPFAGQASLGSPAVTNGASPAGITWLTSFLDACSDCGVDFAVLHWYDSATNIDYFKNYITDAHTTTGLPLWITEFGASGTDDEITTFFQTVIPWLESQDFVQRYSYFMAADGLLVTGTEMSDYGKVYATYTG